MATSAPPLSREWKKRPGSRPNYAPLDEQAAAKRIGNYKKVTLVSDPHFQIVQARRCINCGSQPCGWGCPVGHRIPEMLNFVGVDDIADAHKTMFQMNPLYLFGRTCPANKLCQGTCTVAYGADQEHFRDFGRFLPDVKDTVQIQTAESYVWDKAWNAGLINFLPPKRENGIKVGIIGLGAAGLSAALRLRQAGFTVTGYDAKPYIGGLLWDVLPPMKFGSGRDILPALQDKIEQNGIKFVLGQKIGPQYIPGESHAYDWVRRKNDFLVVGTGAAYDRPLTLPNSDQIIPGNALAMHGVNFLMQTVFVASDQHRKMREQIEGRTVIVIGLGDTAADCAMMSHRMGAKVRDLYRGQNVDKRGRNEIRWTEEEGAQFVLKAAPLSIEAAGRARDSFQVDTTAGTHKGALVINAITPRTPQAGESFGNSLLTGSPETPTNIISPRGIWEQIYPTNDPHVIVTGDGAYGARLVMEAVRNGQLAGDWVASKAMQLGL